MQVKTIQFIPATQVSAAVVLRVTGDDFSLDLSLSCDSLLSLLRGCLKQHMKLVLNSFTHQDLDSALQSLDIDDYANIDHQ